MQNMLGRRRIVNKPWTVGRRGVSEGDDEDSYSHTHLGLLAHSTFLCHLVEYNPTMRCCFLHNRRIRVSVASTAFIENVDMATSVAL